MCTSWLLQYFVDILRGIFRMSKKGGKSSGKPVAGKKASEDFRAAFIGSTDLSLTVPVLLVAQNRLNEDTVYSYEIDLGGSPGVKSCSEKKNALLDVALHSYPNRLFAKVSPDVAVAHILEAASRNKESPPLLTALGKYQRLPLVPLEELVKTGAGTGVYEDGTGPDAMSLLLDSGDEFNSYDVSEYLETAKVVRPSTYLVRSTMSRKEQDILVAVAAAQVTAAVPTLLEKLQFVCAHMARYHFYREEHSAARVMADGALCKDGKAHPLLHALLRRQFGSITITGPKAAAAAATATAAPAGPVLDKCAVCGSSNNVSLCSSCKTVAYCSREHQVSHWPLHKAACKPAQGKK